MSQAATQTNDPDVKPEPTNLTLQVQDADGQSVKPLAAACQFSDDDTWVCYGRAGQFQGEKHH